MAWASFLYVSFNSLDQNNRNGFYVHKGRNLSKDQYVEQKAIFVF